MRLFSLFFNHCARAAGEPILPTILHMQKKIWGALFHRLGSLNMHRGERRRRAKRERKRVRREVNNDSWLFRPINRQIFCAKMPSASSSFLDRKILRQETAFPHHGKLLQLFLVRKLIRQRKNTSSSPLYLSLVATTAPLNALIRNSFDCAYM